MPTIIQENIFKVQIKATDALIEQQLIISQQEIIDGLLDKINVVKTQLENLLPEYSRLIEGALSYIRQNENNEAYITVYENMHPLLELTHRLIFALSNTKFKDCYTYWIEQYNIVINDLNEVLQDLRQKIDGDSELSDLLNSIA